MCGLQFATPDSGIVFFSCAIRPHSSQVLCSALLGHDMSADMLKASADYRFSCFLEIFLTLQVKDRAMGIYVFFCSRNTVHPLFNWTLRPLVPKLQTVQVICEKCQQKRKKNNIVVDRFLSRFPLRKENYQLRITLYF